MVSCRSQILITGAAILLSLAFFGDPSQASEAPLITKLRNAAAQILESAQISYVYGGSSIGSAKECKLCNDCLDRLKPSPKERFEKCKDCYSCSLDCSHFVQRVFSDAGIHFPYLTTDTMRQTPPNILLKRYGLIDLGRDVRRSIAGDLLVYKGHVVLLEKVHKPGIGDIVHATGGRDIKGPGEGIQRERHVKLASFRGPLMRILRHQSLYLHKMRKIHIKVQ